MCIVIPFVGIIFYIDLLVNYRVLYSTICLVDVRIVSARVSSLLQKYCISYLLMQMQIHTVYYWLLYSVYLEYGENLF